MGWLAAGRADGRFEPEFAAGLFALSLTNAISPVLESARGCYVAKLIDVRARQVKPFEAVRSALEQRLLLEKRRGVELEWLASVRAEVPATVHEEAMARAKASGGSILPAAEAPPHTP